MKYFPLWFFLVLSSPLIGNPLPLSLDPPLKVNQENRERLIDNPQLIESEAKRNLEILHAKSFPLLQVSLFFIICGALIACKNPIQNYWKKIHQKPIQGPRTRALMTLKSLKKNNFEEFYVKLTNITRQYIEEEYKLQAPYYTTEEFLKKTSINAPFTNQQKALLANFLQSADLVKFAHFNPSEIDCQKAEDTAKEFIEAHIEADIETKKN